MSFLGEWWRNMNATLKVLIVLGTGVLAAFTAGITFGDYVELPEQVYVNSVRITEVEQQIDDMQALLTRQLCLQEAKVNPDITWQSCLQDDAADISRRYGSGDGS